MKSPEVSVLMPVYNGMPYLRQAVESILNQTFGNFELIIIDDGSTDDGPAYLAGLSDQRLRIEINKANLGLAASLNKGLGLVASPLIARHDQDDLSHPDRLRREKAFLDANPEVGLVCSSVIHIDQSGTPRTAVVRKLSPVLLRWRLLFGNPIAHPTVMYRRESVLAVGGYNETNRVNEDYELWSALADRTGLAQLTDPLLLYRIHDASMSVSAKPAQRANSWAISRANMVALLNRQLDDAAIKSLFLAPTIPEACQSACDLILDLKQAFEEKQSLTRQDQILLNRDAAHRLHMLGRLYKSRQPYWRIMQAGLIGALAESLAESGLRKLRDRNPMKAWPTESHD